MQPMAAAVPGISAQGTLQFGRKGAILVIVACGAALFLGFLALVTDIGWTYYHQLKLQTAVNAGWKAGFDDLLVLRATKKDFAGQTGLNRVAAHIRSVIALNYPDTSPPEVSITLGSSISGQPPGALNLRVFGIQNVPLFFSKIFGIAVFRVQATRSTDSDIARDPGILPIAIPHGVVNEPQPGWYLCTNFSANEGFIVGNTYLLQPGTIFSSAETLPPPSDPGLKKIFHTGAIDPDNLPQTGDADFAIRLQNGFQQPLQIDDRIILQDSIPAGTTSSCIAARIASGTAAAILPITDIPPEVASSAMNLGAQTIYDVKGTDDPQGKYSPTEHSFTAAVRIIGFAEFELMSPVESDHGQIRGRFLRYIIKPGAPGKEAPTKEALE